jgi:hypothetical protein
VARDLVVAVLRFHIQNGGEIAAVHVPQVILTYVKINGLRTNVDAPNHGDRDIVALAQASSSERSTAHRVKGAHLTSDFEAIR